VLFDVSEAALFALLQEFALHAPAGGPELVPVLGTVNDRQAVTRALEQCRVGIVLHAAAYKHVPMVEANPRPGLAVNAIGTLTLAQAAEAAGVGRFILVSTDKAVRPCSVLGISKLLAEHAVLDLASRAAGTVFAVVRFGNVFGSSGSVVPVFLDQIARGGPVTLTDPDATRFFMMPHEAAGLVLAAAARARGGETFVLDMGAPIRMGDLARRLIAAGPDPKVAIRLTGLRPGEKRHEELATAQGLVPTAVPGLLLAADPVPSQIAVAAAFRDLRAALDGDDDALSQFVDRWRVGPSASRVSLRLQGRA
jgi:FlaA1/EpsC-like NDP-sugar epimerase